RHKSAAQKHRNVGEVAVKVCADYPYSIARWRAAMRLIQTDFLWVGQLAFATDWQKLVAIGMVVTEKSDRSMIVRLVSLLNTDVTGDPWLSFKPDSLVAMDSRGKQIAAFDPIDFLVLSGFATHVPK